MSRAKGKKIFNIFTYIFATALAIIFLMPFFWMVSTSLKSDGALMALPIEWIPKEPSFNAYKKIFTIFPFLRTNINSLFLAFSVTIINLICSSMAAFVFSKIDFKGRDKIFLLYLATMMIPAEVTTIPLFMIIRKMKLVNSFLGILLPAIINPFSIFMIRQSMMGIHDSYIESALIDGASYFRIFRSIILPLSSGILATVSVITFMGSWNDYFWPLILLTEPEKMTLPVALSKLNGQFSTQYNTMMAGALISMIPAIIVYIAGQKFFTQGIHIGGIKG